MAGFAVVMTIVTFATIGILAASGLSLCLYLLATRAHRDGQQTTRKFIWMSAAAPFLGLLWLIIAFLIHVEISNRLAHQDCGLSGDPYVTLPNGYVLGSHNTYDGYFKAPGFETDVSVAGPGYVRSIIDLRLKDGSFLGTQFDFKTSSVRRFTFDTRTRAFQSSPEGPATWEAANDKAQQGDRSYWKIYAQYRHSWPKYLLWLLIITGEGAIVFWVRRAWTAKDTIVSHV
jgi:hypothetical protein